MPAERYFYLQDFHKSETFSLEDKEFHHLIHVMRTRIGEEIEFINGKGQLAKGHIVSIEKKRANVVIEYVYSSSPKPNELILAQAIPKLNRLEFILEKSVELGATEIWLFPSTLSEKKSFSENQLQRFHAILISAMKQCGRLFLPSLKIMPPIASWNNLPHPFLFGDTRNDAPPLLKNYNRYLNFQTVLFCVGPESGFTEEEVSLLTAKGGEGVKLHENILRTDTAALSALSLLSHFLLFR
jgi:16S rRNA (uracil1498-N3)-methyltransferase